MEGKLKREDIGTFGAGISGNQATTSTQSVDRYRYGAELPEGGSDFRASE